MEYISTFAFSKEEVEYLKTLRRGNGEPLFSASFLKYLQNISLELDILAVPEGTLVYPLEPLLRVQGPIIHCILVESALLNILNFQTSVATKASRLFMAANGSFVLDFSLRRSRGVDNSVATSRAAYIGGCVASSNVLFSKMFGLSPKGTQSHTMVLLFESELEAFRVQSDVCPEQCVVLIDTYDVVQGIQNAIIVGKKLQKLGLELYGVRIDSGDLLQISRQVRKCLDQSGLYKTKIYASGNLCEFTICELKKDSAPIDFWGVGSYLVSEKNAPLDSVYKLSCVRYQTSPSWFYKMKFSENQEKESLPGALQIRRYSNNGRPVLDVIYNEFSDTFGAMISENGERKLISSHLQYEELLIFIFRKGKKVYESPSVIEMQKYVVAQIKSLSFDMKKIKDPAKYEIFLEESLYNLKKSLKEKENSNLSIS